MEENQNSNGNIPTFSNQYISELLRSIAAVYLLKNENRFRIIAYEKAADTVEHLSRNLHDIWREGRSPKLPGIGPAISAHLHELFETGRSPYFEEVLGSIPSTVFVLMRVPGIGPKKAFKLVQTLRLFNNDTIIEDLKKAAEAGQIATIESFGSKSEQDILESLGHYQKSKGSANRLPMAIAFSEALKLTTYLKECKAIKRIDALGSLRRMVSTIGDVDIAVVMDDKDGEEVINHFIGYPDKLSVDNAGSNKASIIVPPNLRVDLRIQNKESYGSMLQYFTGSKSHNIKLREFALRKGYSLSEWGIKTIKNEELREKNENGKSKADDYDLKFDNEKDFYEFLGLQYVPPEIREGTNEVELAAKHQLPTLVEVKDIKGDFHIHSSYTDMPSSHDYGINSYEEIVEQARSCNYEYVGFADHNPKISDTTEEEIVGYMKARKQYIDQLFRSKNMPNFKYFIGLECDIQPSGELALPDSALEYVDYLVVSVHSSFQQDINTMTERVLKALSKPKVKIFGHPTGRLIGKRDGYELHWDKIFNYVAEKNIALEINSTPQRLDLPEILVREGKDRGVKFFINTDAHATVQMENMFYGVSVARRGWLEKEHVINTMNLKEMEEWIKS
jgi:DNA polymerase (family X)